MCTTCTTAVTHVHLEVLHQFNLESVTNHHPPSCEGEDATMYASKGHVPTSHGRFPKYKHKTQYDIMTQMLRKWAVFPMSTWPCYLHNLHHSMKHICGLHQCSKEGVGHTKLALGLACFTCDLYNQDYVHAHWYLLIQIGPPHQLFMQLGTSCVLNTHTCWHQTSHRPQPLQHGVKNKLLNTSLLQLLTYKFFNVQTHTWYLWHGCQPINV